MKKNHFLTLVLALGSIVSQAQVSAYTFHRAGSVFPYVTGSQNVTVHTVSDDQVSPAIVSLPFMFNFGGVNHNSVGISENGFIWFGPAQPSELSFIAPISTTQPTSVQGIISALGIDLHPVASTTIKSAVIGEAPNRTFVIEWFATARIETLDLAAGPDIIDCQIRLSETTNVVEITYGRTIMNPNLNSDTEVGLKKSDSDFNIRATISPSWETEAGNSLNATCLLGNLSKPNFGHKFVWTPASLDVDDFSPNQIVLYPNPAADFINVQGLAQGAFDYVIYDMTGRTLKQSTAQGNTITLDGLSSGNYIVNITSGDLSMSRKFVKL